MPQPSSRPSHRDALALSAGVTWALVLCAVVLYRAFERDAYARLLNLGALRLTPDEAWLLPATVVGTTLLLVAPAGIVGVGLGWSRSRRAARIGLGVSVALALAFAFVDLGLYASIGRHIAAVLAFARLPEGHRAAGDLGSWVSECAQWVL